MTYENIKSIILTVLVTLSILLTWNLWTYQPNYETMENPNYLKEVSLGKQKGVNEIIQPTKILYHTYESHFGTTNSKDIDRTLQDISKWNFYEAENISDGINHLSTFIQKKGMVEIVFPDSVPVEMYRHVIKFEEKELPSFKFNKIVIDVETRAKADGRVYFVNDEDQKNHQIYASHIKSGDMKNFYNEFFIVADQLSPYFPYKLTDESTLFLPQDVSKMISYKYFLDKLDTSKFKDALFDDPSYVQRSDFSATVEYTDGQRMLTIDNNLLMLYFVNPAEDSDLISNTKELLQKSVDFVNQHGGWTGSYQYETIDEAGHTATFRLYDSNGYPIFDEKGLTKIVQVWGQKGIYKYVRPTFVLDLPLMSEATEVVLPPVNEVLESIKTKRGFEIALLKDVRMGYSLKRNSIESLIVTLEPSWFYKYGNSWVQFTPDELGGNNLGLE